MNDKWTQIVFVVAITVGVFFYNRQKRTIYNYEPPSEERIPCDTIPSMMERKEDCEAALCLWKESVPPLPNCFQPKDIDGYVVQGALLSESSHLTFNLVHKKNPYSPFPESIMESVKFELIKYNDRIVRFKFTNAADSRYEVPVQETLDFLKRPRNVEDPQYTFEAGTTPNKFFQFNIRRKGSEAKLIDTSIGNLIMTNQFLQFVTYLPSSNVYGFGEFSHRHLRSSSFFKTFAMFSRDQPPQGDVNLYGVHPFYMCVENDGKAHGVLMLNSNAMEYTLLSAPALRLDAIGGVLDIFLFVGETPTHVVELYSDLIGKPFLPPYWALGFQLSKFGYGSLKNVKEVVERNRQAGIPLDVINLDIDYMNNGTVFSVDSVNFRGLESYMDQERESTGLRFLINLTPALLADSKHNLPFIRGIEANAFISWPSITPINERALPPGFRAKHNILYGRLWPCGPAAYVDFFRNTTEPWWEAELSRLRKRLPYDGVWMGMNEPAQFSSGSRAVTHERATKCFKNWVMQCPISIHDDPPYPTRAATFYGPDKRLHDRTLCMVARQGDQEVYSHYDVHSLYGWSETIVTHRVLQKLVEERILILSRSTYPSSGKYAGHWLGDNRSRWVDLHRSIIGMLEFNMFGIPYVGADICGFFGRAEEKMCVRWTQLGAFYPFSRNHNHHVTPPQDPAAFSEAAIAVMKSALQVRYNLLPYLYTLFYLAHQNGTPVVRPLFFEFPREIQTYRLDKQFMWGGSILVSPLLEDSATYMSFYVPPGLWFNYYTMASFQSTGEYMILNDIALNTSTPLYVRAGSIIPVQKGNHTSTNDRLAKAFTLLVYPADGRAHGNLYWDDGVSKHAVQDGLFDFFSFDLNSCRLAVTNAHVSKKPIRIKLRSVMVANISLPAALHVDGREKTLGITKIGGNGVEFKVELRLDGAGGYHTVEWTYEDNRCIKSC